MAPMPVNTALPFNMQALVLYMNPPEQMPMLWDTDHWGNVRHYGILVSHLDACINCVPLPNTYVNSEPV